MKVVKDHLLCTGTSSTWNAICRVSEFSYNFNIKKYTIPGCCCCTPNAKTIFDFIRKNTDCNNYELAIWVNVPNLIFEDEVEDERRIQRKCNRYIKKFPPAQYWICIQVFFV